VLAIVLREAVTNVLRHSAARNCAIVANQEDKMITLKVINDGVPQPVKPGTGGHGLHNMARRLEVMGGELDTGGSHDDQFSLLAIVPAQGRRVSPVGPGESRLSGPHPP
jgi:two-component system, NarL family, sensor histidine kinase DesK